MMPSRIIQIVRLAIPLIAFHTMAYPVAAQSGVDPARAIPAASPSPTIAKLLAKAGYVGIPFSYKKDDRGPYLFVDAKIDTTTVDFILDSGLSSGDFLLDPSFAKVSGVHLTVSNTGASLYGTVPIREGTIDRVTLGPLALGPLVGALVTPPIPASGLFGATLFADRAAIFDFDTDTLYLLAADTTLPLLKQPTASPARSLGATLKAAGQYRTFLSLMQTAGLMPFLDQPTRGDTALDSLTWVNRGAQAIVHAGLDTMPAGAERRRLTHQAMDQEFRPAGQVTVFAPTDAVFAHLAPNTLRALRADRAQLAAVLRAHLLTSTYLRTSTLRTLIRGVTQSVGPTLGFHPIGSRLDVDRLTSQENRTVLARATIVQPDLLAVNGVAHGIDRLLIAPASPSPLTVALERQGYVAIPLRRLPSGSFVVQVEVNGTPLTLEVDTGAPNELSLDIEVARRLNVLDEASVSVALGTGLVLSLTPQLEDMGAVNSIANEDPPIHGLLGANLLAAYHARFDIGTGTLYLRRPAPTAAGEPRPSSP